MTPKDYIVRSLVLGVCALFSAPAVQMQAQTASRVTLATLAPDAVDALDRAIDMGPVPSSQQISFTVTIAPTSARTAALDHYLTALTMPGSSIYHQWITPEQFATSYGATADQLAAAAGWAQSQGLTVDAVSPSGLRLAISGPAARVQNAFAAPLHFYLLHEHVYRVNVAQPSLPADVAPLFAAIEGLDDLPRDRANSLAAPAGTDAPAATVNGAPFVLSAANLGSLVDANATAILAIDAASAMRSPTASDLAAYATVFRQAAAQGITVLARGATGQFLTAFPDLTALTIPPPSASASLAAATVPDAGLLPASFAPRPAWQVAPGLPPDNLRHAPDLAATSLTAFTQTIQNFQKIGNSGTIEASTAGTRLGNIAPVLYSLAPTPGLFSQPDGAAPGTWEAATGLGLVDLQKLADAFPRGTGASFTSFQATNYAPIHGQSTSFTSVVTSGNGGATPTGTVSFSTAAGVTLGTVVLSGGSATLTINKLDSGNYIVGATYSGDATYATSSSPTSQIYIAPEPSQLSAVVSAASGSASGSVVVGSNFTVTVTDAVTLGAPSGSIALGISGSSSTLSQTLVAVSPTSSTATFSIPATQPGGITLSINCSTSLNYSCNNPLTTTVTIVKATPVLSISYTPNPPVSGQQITLNAVVSTIGAAPAPTGNVRFLDNGTLLNAGTLAGGNTTTTGTVPSTATHNITATYDGDPNYNSVSTTTGTTSSSTITTTTVLGSSSTVVNAGQSITLSAKVTPSSSAAAAPTGTVQFFDGVTSLGTANLSTPSITTSALSATVSHSITAVYSGDAFYMASTSPIVVLSAGASSTTPAITFTASTTAPVHGTLITFTANVIAPVNGPVPTGTVNFATTQGPVLALSTLINGVATFQTNVLHGGVNTLIAVYNGNATYTTATSSTLTATVSPEPVQLAISLPANPTFGKALAVTVLVAGASGVTYPTGQVTLAPSGNGYTTSSTGTLASAGGTSTSSAPVVLQATAAGSVVLSATYAGDQNFAAGGPVSATLTVARAASTTVLSYTPTPPVPGQSITLTAKVAFTATPGPTGNVQFKDGSAVLGIGILDATGTATFTTTLTAGNHTLSAVYAGDANYLASTSPSTNTATGTSPTTTTLSLSTPILALGAAETLSATVGPVVNGLIPTGQVQFVSAGNVLCTAILSATSATTSCTPAFTVVGTQSIVASYLGDANYAASSSIPATLTVTAPAGSLVATLAPTTIAPSSAATVTATVTAPAGVVPAGAISATILNSAGTVQSTYTTPLPGTGTASTVSVTIPIISPQFSGTYSVAVACIGTNFSCPGVTLPFVISTAPTAGTAVLTAVVTPATAQPSSAVTVTGTITATTGTALTGSVSATITGVAGAVYTVALPGTAVTNGTFSLPIVAPPTPGAYTVVISCTSAAFTCAPVSASLTASNSALIPTKTSLAAALSTTASGATIFTATVTPAITAAMTGTAAPTGSITFLDGNTSIGVGTVTSGVASISLTVNQTVTHSYTAVYAGDALYAGSTSLAITGTMSSAPPVVTLTSSTAGTLAGQNVILTAQVTGLTPLGVGPTGTISFYATGSVNRLLGTVTLAAQGTGVAIAVLSTTGLPSGTLSIDAVYSGDTNFSTATSNIVTIGLADFALAFNPGTLTLHPGAAAASIVSVALLGGLQGTVTLGCTPDPTTLISCSFSPAVVSASGTSTLVVKTTAAHAALTPGPALSGHPALFGGVSLATLLCLLLPGRSRRRIPAMLLVLLGVVLLPGLGCSDGTFAGPNTTAGTPLGTTILTINTAASDGTNTVRHTYYYQVTIN